MLPQACSPRGEGPGGGGGRVRVRMGAPPLSQRGKEVGGGKTHGLGRLGERNRQREGPRGLSGPHPCSPRPGQDTHLSLPRLLLRKRRAILVTSSVRLHVAWSISLPRGAQVRSAFFQGTQGTHARGHSPRAAWMRSGFPLPPPLHPALGVLTQTSAAPEASVPAQPTEPVPAAGPGSQRPAHPETCRKAGSGPAPPSSV